MKRHDVRLSVCPSTGPQQQTRCCRIVAVGLVGRKYRSTAAAISGVRWANAGSATLSAYVGSWSITDYCCSVCSAAFSSGNWKANDATSLGSVGPFDENVSNFVRNPLLQQGTALISFVGVVKNVGNTKLQLANTRIVAVYRGLSCCGFISFRWHIGHVWGACILWAYNCIIIVIRKNITETYS